jgi:hypothetical protein
MIVPVLYLLVHCTGTGTIPELTEGSLSSRSRLRK